MTLTTIFKATSSYLS